MEIQFFKRNKSVHRRVVKNERRADFHSSPPFLRGINTWTACVESFNIFRRRYTFGATLSLLLDITITISNMLASFLLQPALETTHPDRAS